MKKNKGLFTLYLLLWIQNINLIVFTYKSASAASASRILVSSAGWVITIALNIAVYDVINNREKE